MARADHIIISVFLQGIHLAAVGTMIAFSFFAAVRSVLVQASLVLQKPVFLSFSFSLCLSSALLYPPNSIFPVCAYHSLLFFPYVSNCEKPARVSWTVSTISSATARTCVIKVGLLISPSTEQTRRHDQIIHEEEPHIRHLNPALNPVGSAATTAGKDRVSVTSSIWNKAAGEIELMLHQSFWGQDHMSKTLLY